MQACFIDNVHPMYNARNSYVFWDQIDQKQGPMFFSLNKTRLKTSKQSLNTPFELEVVDNTHEVDDDTGIPRVNRQPV